MLLFALIFTFGCGNEEKEYSYVTVKINPEVEDHIFSSLHSVNIDTFCGYKENGVLHSFLETYDKKGEKWKQ